MITDSKSTFRLAQVLKSAQISITQNQSFAAVFDLDSTLFRVEPRILHILKEFAKIDQWRRHSPQFAQILDRIEKLPDVYHFRDILNHLGLGLAPNEFKSAIHGFWLERFFHNDYLFLDVPYEGAVEFVVELYQQGAEIIYLTGRDQPRMEAGTIKSLGDHGFPVNAKRVQTILKPHHELDDALFKLKEMENLSRQFSKIWFFENEPANIHLIHKKLPNVDIVYFESVHSGTTEPPGPHIHRIQSFVEKE